MPESLVFEDERVLRQLRRQAAWTVAVAAVGFIGGLVLLSLMRRYQIADLPTAGMLCLGWGGLTAWAALRLYRLQQHIWRLQLSATALTGYDYGRHAWRIDWSLLDHVELTDQDLRITTRDGRRFVIPGCHADFPELGHALVDKAERLGCPLYVNGRPFEALDIRTLLPLPPDITLPADSSGQPSA
ncbi:MAG: hypothetical protein Q9M35_12700 [Rhodothermus sp.]|nr:hypothetical protein [Rhodothermus sp.]